MRIAVAILNWNGKALLARFLPDVIQHSYPDAEIYVIDNASADGSVEFLKAQFPSVKIIVNDKNYGYARGYNEGLKNIDAEYFVLLNSDVQVTKNWIGPVISLLDSDKGIAACQPKLLNHQVRDEFEYAGGAGGFIDKYGYPFCRGRMFNSFEKDAGQYNDTREIFWASGACLFIRSRNFFEAGMLDEDFFAHMEEIDLCWRIRNLGYKIFYCADSTVFHVGAGTLAKKDPKKTYYNFRNNLLMLVKNHATRYFVPKLFLRCAIDGVAAARFFLSGDLAHSSAVLKAHYSYYGLFMKMYRKRKEIQKNIRKYATGCVYHGSVVWAYFVRGKEKFSELNKMRFDTSEK